MRNFFLIFIIAVVAMSQKCEDDPKPQEQAPTTATFDEGISGKLGERITQIVSHANAAEVYQLNPEAGLPEGSAGLQGFLIAKGPHPLNPDQVTDLKLQLGQDSLYSFSTSMNMCLFLPNYGVRFMQGDSTQVDMLISMHCNEFRFYEGEELISVDCLPPAAKVEEYVAKAFK